MWFYHKFTQLDFGSLNVVLASNIRCTQRIIFIIQTHPSKDVHKNMLNMLILLKINSATNALIIICKKFFGAMFLRTAPDGYF